MVDNTTNSEKRYQKAKSKGELINPYVTFSVRK